MWTVKPLAPQRTLQQSRDKSVDNDMQFTDRKLFPMGRQGFYNPHFQMLDLFFKFLSAHHECNVVVYGLSCEKEATNKISTWCQPFRNIYNYTDYGNGTDGWKLYSVARDCVEVDDLCLSKERCKKTTQKYWHLGCLGHKLSVLSKTSAEKMTFSWDIFLSMGHFVLL